MYTVDALVVYVPFDAVFDKTSSPLIYNFKIVPSYVIQK
jgi:hypothetical protein